MQKRDVSYYVNDDNVRSSVLKPVGLSAGGPCESVLFSLQYVVIPTRRSTAEAFQILMSHLLGDAGSPYLIGLVGTKAKLECLLMFF